MKWKNALPKMDDPSELLKDLGEDTIKQLESFLEENELVLDVLIYRTKNKQKIWEPRK